MTDVTDLEILQELQKDGRISLRKISENLDKSPSTVSNRFQEMSQTGIIRNFHPDINLQKIGLELSGITQIKANGKKMSKIKEELLKFDFIEKVYIVTGETDIMALGRFQDREEMNKSVQEIQKLEGVEDSKTNLILEEEDRTASLNRLMKPKNE